MPASPAEATEDASPTPQKIPLDLISLCQAFFLMDTLGRKTGARQFGFLSRRTTGARAGFTRTAPRVHGEVNISLGVSDVTEHLQARWCGRGAPSRASSRAKPCAKSQCKAPVSPARGRDGQGQAGTGRDRQGQAGPPLPCALGTGSAVAAPLCVFGMG